MLVYNLTNMSKPGGPQRMPKTLVVGTQAVEPGKFVEVPDSLPRREIAALLQDETISIGYLPHWYQEATKAALTAPPAPAVRRRTKKE